MYPTISDQELDAVPVRECITVPPHQFQRAVGKGFHAIFRYPDYCIMQRMAPPGHLYPGW
jgi:hypothetical protein